MVINVISLDERAYRALCLEQRDHVAPRCARRSLIPNATLIPHSAALQVAVEIIRGLAREMVEIDHAAVSFEPPVQHDDALYRAFVQYCADALTLVDSKGAMLYNSPSSERVLGYSAEELGKLNLFDLIHPDDLDVSLLHFQDALKEPRGRAQGVARMKRGDGSWRWMEGSAVNLLDEPGVEAIVLTFHDITERKFAEDRFR